MRATGTTHLISS